MDACPGTWEPGLPPMPGLKLALDFLGKKMVLGHSSALLPKQSF